MSKTLAFIAAFMALAGSVFAADTQRPLERALAKAMERGWPGAGVLVERADGKFEIATEGSARLEDQHPMTAQSGFHMCSINKVFTAAAVLRLVDAGKLTLDRKVTVLLDERIVGGIPHIDEITVRQLLDHSSGIYPTNNDPAYLKTLIGSDAFPARVWKPDELVALATRPENKPSGKPGEGHHYSDTNYILLGMIVERVTGETFKAHVARTILRPLGMDATYFHSDALEGTRVASPAVAHGYMKLSKALTDAVAINPRFPSPRDGWLNTSAAAERIDAAGGMVTTLPDLRKFASALFRGKLLSAKSRSVLDAVQGEMANAGIGAGKTRTLQGSITKFGFVLYKEGDGPGGFNTLMAFHPRSGTIFLGFVNQFGDFDEVEVMMNEIMGGVTTN